jgi:hypothetical protein
LQKKHLIVINAFCWEGEEVPCSGCWDEKYEDKCDYCLRLYLVSTGQHIPERLKRVKKPKPEKKPLGKRKCKGCEKEYMPTRKYQAYCSGECRPKRLTDRERFLRGPVERGRQDSNRVAYGFFRKKYGVKNNVFRG